MIDLSSLPTTLWQPQSARQRLVGKQSVSDYIPPPTERRVVVSHKNTVRMVTWSPEEQEEINAAPDWRQRERVQKRLLHNRTATDLGLHVLGAFDAKGPISCQICCKSTRIANLARFLKEECGGEVDRDQPADQGAARNSVKLRKLVKLAEEYNQHSSEPGKHFLAVPKSVDDGLYCCREACGLEQANGWRRFSWFAKTQCLANP